MPGASEPIYSCPFTGKAFSLSPYGGGRWVPEGLFNPKQPFESESDAIQALCLQRNGKTRPKPSYFCPYSKKKFRIVFNERSKKWVALGLFAPIRAYNSIEEANFALSTRHGVKPTFPSEPAATIHVQVVGTRERTPTNPVDDYSGVGEEFVDYLSDKLTQQ